MLFAAATRVCEICGHTAAQTVFERSTQFTLFFIPLFPVRRAVQFVQCAYCGAQRRTDPAALESPAGRRQ